jgi:carbon storage regulator
MLVLSRKKNESVVINNDITITVVEIRGDKVRLGIVSPHDVPVHRQEVYDAIHGRTEAFCEPDHIVRAPHRPMSYVDVPISQMCETSLEELLGQIGVPDVSPKKRPRFTGEGGIAD